MEKALTERKATVGGRLHRNNRSSVEQVRGGDACLRCEWRYQGMVGYMDLKLGKRSRLEAK